MESDLQRVGKRYQLPMFAQESKLINCHRNESQMQILI